MFLRNLIDRAKAQQPPPSYSLDSIPVVASLRDSEIPSEIFEGLLDRMSLGLESYKTPLMSHNGRDNVADAVQELLDALLYLQAAKLTEGISDDDRQALWQLLDYLEFEIIECSSPEEWSGIPEE